MPVDTPNFPHTFKVTEAAGRLDRYLAATLPQLSRSYLQKLIREGSVTVNHKPARVSLPLLPGDQVECQPPAFAALETAACDLVPILFEDKDLIVVNKPAGWVVHPAGPHQTGTLVQKLWPKLEKAWGPVISGRPLHTARPGVVHRLDRGTSGVMVIAKNPQTAEHLSTQFHDRKVSKTYGALVHGVPSGSAGKVESTLGRSRQNKTRMTTEGPGRYALTHWRLLKAFADHAWLEVTPHTGRTHQIRAHLSALGHPVMGDTAYDAPASSAQRAMLHAQRLSFTHPRTRRKMTFEVPPPQDFLALVNALQGFDS